MKSTISTIFDVGEETFFGNISIQKPPNFMVKLMHGVGAGDRAGQRCLLHVESSCLPGIHTCTIKVPFFQACLYSRRKVVLAVQQKDGNGVFPEQ